MIDPTKRLARRVLLIGWDAADWRLIDPLVEQGLMPHLARLLEGGTMGNVASLTPMLSPMLWTSIATGKHADKHQILGFAEPDGTTGKSRPVTSTSRRCKAIWNILSDHGLKCGAVNWFASHPAEAIDGFVVTDRYPHPTGPFDQEWPAAARSVHPASRLDELAQLRVHPAQTTPAQLLPFIPALAELHPTKDERLRQLRTLLAHCASVHNATTHLMQNEDWDFLGVYYDTIDRVGHAFMDFHPPQREGVSDDDFRRFSEVVTGCYRFHDMMLGRLLELAGEDTVTILLSDHGFHSDDGRPEGSSRIKDGQPVAWHRTYGVLALHGPHIRKDERVYGASLLDITPTILTLFGLPVADDMDGRALHQVLDTVPTTETVPTYEDGAEAEAPPPEDDPWVAEQMLQQLKALGYVGDDDTDAIVADRHRNLAQVYLATGRPRLAIGAYEDVLERKPDDAASRMGIASAQMQLGALDEAEAAVREILGDELDRPQARLFLGMIESRRGNDDAAIEHLSAAEALNPRLTGLQVQIGQVHMRHQRWADAERAFQTALEYDEDNAEAHDGLGVVCRQLGQPARAVRHHMEAIGRLHHRPQSHINLGLAAAQIGRIPWAIRAFETALSIAPDHPTPHQALAQIYARGDRNPEKAEHHRQRAAELVSGVMERRQERRDRRAGGTDSDQ